MAANDKQVGGDHYRSPIQHWDFVAANDLDYFQGQITRYVTRWRKKDGIEDLYKARHFLEKYIELQERAQDPEDTMSMSIGREENVDRANVIGCSCRYGSNYGGAGCNFTGLGVTDGQERT